MGAVRLLAGQSVGVGAGTRQRAGVGEHGEHLLFAPEEHLVVRRQLPRHLAVPGHQLARVAGVDVEAQHLAPEGVEDVPAPRLGAGLWSLPLLERAEVDARVAVGLLTLEGLELEQGSGRLHLHVGRDQHVGDAPVHRGGHGQLHLHRLEHDEPVARSHLVTGLHEHRDHDRWCRSTHDAAGVAADAVRDPVDLEQKAMPVDDGEHAVRPTSDK